MLLPCVRRKLEHIRTISAVGLGLKEVYGHTTSELCWRIYVGEKFSSKHLCNAQHIPRKIFGLPTDVIIRADSRRCNAQTIAGGQRIVNSRGVPGTAGGLVSEKSSASIFVLTNHHVLFGNGAVAGESIWSADKFDTIRQIGNTYWGKFGNQNELGTPVFIDAALGKIHGQFHDADLTQPALVVDLMPGDTVCKIGAGTGFTKGVVIDIAYPDQINTGKTFIEAPNQLLIEPIEQKVQDKTFSGPGDSGAMLTTENGQFAALLWGSNSYGEGIATPIKSVLSSLPLHEPELMPFNYELTLSQN